MEITVIPNILNKAKQAGLPVRAFWVWQFLKHHCKAGGTIPEQVAKDLLMMTGYCRASCYKWLSDAVKIGLLSLEVSNRTGLVYYRLASWADGAKIVGCKREGKSVTIPLEKYLSRSWMPHIWAAYRLQTGGRDEKIAKLSRDKNTGKAVLTVQVRKAKPISRETLTELTGVSRRAQQYREKRAGVEQVENYLIGRSGMVYQPYGHDKEHPEHHVHCGEERLRLPNSVKVPNDIKLSDSNSRTRRINKALKALRQSDAIAEGEHYQRLYADSFEHAMALYADVIYPTGRHLPSRPGEPTKQAWRRMQQHEK